MVDKIKALKLREDGKTYKEIAEELDCSVDWCKRNLQGHCKHTKEKPVVEKLTKRAKLKHGITSGEIKMEVRKLYPNDFSKEDKENEIKHINRFKAKVKKDKDSIIRPYWLVPENAQDIFYAVLRKLQERDDRLQEDIDDIRQEFGLDASYSDSLAYALVTMSAKGSIIIKRPVALEIDRIANIVEVLEERNNSTETKKPLVDSKEGVRIKSPIDLSDIEEFIY